MTIKVLVKHVHLTSLPVPTQPSDSPVDQDSINLLLELPVVNVQPELPSVPPHLTFKVVHQDTMPNQLPDLM